MMHYSGIDKVRVVEIANSLLDEGIWLENLDLAVGPEKFEAESSAVIFATLCAHFKARQEGREETLRMALLHYCNLILERRSDAVAAASEMERMIDFIQGHLRFRDDDVGHVGEAAGIGKFIGSYWNQKEIPCYELSPEDGARYMAEAIESMFDAASEKLGRPR